MQSFDSLFPLQNSWLLIFSLLLAITSLFLSNNNKDKWAIFCLFCCAFLLRLFMAQLDPFLHEWDERYHALVARNMMHDPFKPMLLANPIIPYDYKLWSNNSIWLHKQPLFMWQMALSMKLFGVSEFSMRIPTALMGALLVLIIHRITFLCTSNTRIAFIAAILMCFSYFNLEQTTGYFGREHNEVAFIFYVLASIWAYAEYRNKQKLSWVILIGIFAGCAILNKWLTGLIVFAGWGMNIIIAIRDKNSRKEILHLLVALLVCAIVFLPWQIYILHTFPIEAKYEFEYNARHITEAMEGHSGDIGFYFDNFSLYFGYNLSWLLFVGMLMPLFVKKYYTKVTFALFFNILLVFIFFSFIVQTKLSNYFMFVVPIGYIFMAIGAYHILNTNVIIKKPTGSISNRVPVFKLDLSKNLTKFGRYMYIPLLIIIAFIIFNLPDITAKHDPKNDNGDNDLQWNVKTYNTNIYRNLRKNIPANIKVVLNAKVGDDIPIMFYNNNITAYAWALTDTSFKKYIADKNIPIAFFKAHGEYGIPDYIKNYPLTFMIDEEIK